MPIYSPNFPRTLCYFDVRIENSLLSTPFLANSIDAVDEENQVVYYSGNKDTPTERHAYRARFDVADDCPPGATEPLTTASGWHSVTVDLQLGVYVDVFSSVSEAPRTTIHLLSDSSLLGQINDNSTDARLVKMAASLQTPIIKVHFDCVDSTSQKEFSCCLI